MKMSCTVLTPQSDESSRSMRVIQHKEAKVMHVAAITDVCRSIRKATNVPD